jgi:hypothetical protein
MAAVAAAARILVQLTNFTASEAAASTRRALLAAAPLRVRGVHATAASRRAGQCPVARWPRPSPRTRAMLVCARVAARELERTTRQHVQAPVGPRWITWAGCPCVHTSIYSIIY